MSFARLGPRGALATSVFAVALFLLAVPLAAGAAVYPTGGGAFAADAEGWQETDASCNVSLLSTCETSGEFDGTAGNPAGSLAAHTHLILNLAALFESTVALESPDFTVAEGGAATVHVDRQFVPESLLSLSPQAGYSISLLDRDSGTSSEVVDETLGEADGAFAGKDGVAAVSAGHTYALAIEATTTALAALGLLETDSFVRFDNVSLTIGSGSAGGGGSEGEGDAGGAGGGSAADGSGGAGTPSDSASSSAGLDPADLRTLVRRGDSSTARLRGTQVFVRLRCPRRARRTCRITAQGRIRKRTSVTWRRTARIASGNSRLVALRVKRRFRERVAQRKRLLVVQRVRVGRVTTTFARSRALIRRR